MKFLSAVLSVIVLNCSNSEEGLFSEKNMLFLRAGTASLSGKVMKGAVKNAAVSVYALNKDGTCSTNSGPIAAASTDSDGNYKAYFPKTGRPVCVIATPKSDSKMYDEASKADISWTGAVSMTMIIKEPIGGASKTGLNLTPLSRFAAARLQSIAKNNSTGSRLDEQVTYANKQIAVQFGLHKGFAKKNALTRADSSSIDLDSIPDILDEGIKLDIGTDSNAKYVKALLGGFSVIAKNTKKADANLTATDVEAVMQAFEKDLADGTADGKNESGENLLIQNGSGLGAFPLTSTLQNAVSTYIQSDSSLGLTVADAASLSFVQSPTFVQNVPTAPSKFSYPNSSYTFTQNIAIAGITPVLSGAVTSCTSSPVLPSGLSLNQTNCSLSGTPTSIQSAASYTITASNVYGFATAAISVTVNNSPLSGLTYSSSSYIFPITAAIAAVTPSVTGTISNCTITPSLPAGLSLNAANCAISGTPTTASAAANYNVTASNTASSTATTISITVFSPIQLSGITFWLKADAGVYSDAGITPAVNGAPVQQWNDQSAGLIITQATAAYQPKFYTNVINSRSVVRFDGVDDYLSKLSVAGSSLLSASEGDIFLVQYQDGVNATNTPFSWESTFSSNRFLAHFGNNSVAFDFSNSTAGQGRLSPTVPTNMFNYWILAELYRNTSTADNTDGLYLNGNAASSNGNFTTNLSIAPTATFYIGTYPIGGPYFSGEIAEILFFNRALSTAERNQVQCYLSKKYSITVSGTCP
ncbi:MAG TPA: putative Ig domain-containing protein [Leptospiraceae bacterium]|nr:putative Ig domain-containing protein [Leptospiraceae bacterium]